MEIVWFSPSHDPVTRSDVPAEASSSSAPASSWSDHDWYYSIIINLSIISCELTLRDSDPPDSGTLPLQNLDVDQKW